MPFDFGKLLLEEKALHTRHSQSASHAAKLFSNFSCNVILDLGCGNGRDTLFLAQNGFQVIGVDIAARAIARLVARKKGEFLVADARRLPFKEESFDAVYSFGLLHVFTTDIGLNRKKVMAEIYRILKPGGLAFITALWTDQEGYGLPKLCCLTRYEIEQVCYGFFILAMKIIGDCSFNGWEGVYWQLVLKRPESRNI